MANPLDCTVALSGDSVSVARVAGHLAVLGDVSCEVSSSLVVVRFAPVAFPRLLGRYITPHSCYITSLDVVDDFHTATTAYLYNQQLLDRLLHADIRAAANREHSARNVRGVLAWRDRLGRRSSLQQLELE
jgi:hypothetical protein